MAGALFSRIKNWNEEILTNEDLNAEIDNILNNFIPTMMDDYSVNVAQMQITTDPGEVGSESLATTLAGEIARLRFLIAEITGKDEWYESPGSSLAGLSNAIGTGITDNRLISGRIATTSSQPMFLVPNGAAKTVTLKGATTNFLYSINGVEYTISSDVTITNLTAAPTSNNTCLVNDTVASAQYWTAYEGEDGTAIPVDTMGTEITALVGKFAAFKISTEYFIAYVESTTKLSKVFRGYFFNSTDAKLGRVTYSNNDSISLMKLTWVFAKTDSTLTATYNNPIWAAAEPSSPSIGDYWFDTVNQTWKVYGVGSFSSAGATLVGVCIQDGTNTVAARSYEFFAGYRSDNTVELFYNSATQLKSKYPGSVINAWGINYKYERNILTWDITTDRETGVSEASSTYYYFYVTQTGGVKISNIKPYDRREDLLGYYHPHESWRCVGSAFNNGSSDLTAVNSYFTRYVTQEISPAQTAAMDLDVISRIIKIDTSGASRSDILPPCADWRGQTYTFIKTSSDFNIYTLDGFGSETINGATTTTLATQYELIDLFSDGTEIFIKRRYIPGGISSFTPTGALTTNTTYAGRQWRVGDQLYMKITLTFAGANTQGLVTVTLPNSLTIDTTKILDTTSESEMFGYAIYDDANGTDSGKLLGSVHYSSTTVFRLTSQNTAGDNTTDVVNSSTGSPQTFSTGDIITIFAQFPITGWSG